MLVLWRSYRTTISWSIRTEPSRGLGSISWSTWRQCHWGPYSRDSCCHPYSDWSSFWEYFISHTSITLCQNLNKVSFKYKNNTVHYSLCNKFEFYTLDWGFQSMMDYISNASSTLVWTDNWRNLKGSYFFRNGDSSLIKWKPPPYHIFLTNNSVTTVESIYSPLAYPSRWSLKSTLR